MGHVVLASLLLKDVVEGDYQGVLLDAVPYSNSPEIIAHLEATILVMVPGARWDSCGPHMSAARKRWHFSAASPFVHAGLE